MHFCVAKYETFKGCEDALASIRCFLSDTTKHTPLVVYAESGVGKTSLLAAVTHRIPSWFGDKCVRVVRFLGTSPESTDVFSVLFSVAGQLADSHGTLMEPVGYRTMKSLVNYLPRFLRNISRMSKEHVFILLDSIDQLQPSDAAYSLKWLPLELPSRVHIVISTLPATHGILDNARRLIRDPTAFVQVQPLPEKTGNEIIGRGFMADTLLLTC